MLLLAPLLRAAGCRVGACATSLYSSPRSACVCFRVAQVDPSGLDEATGVTLRKLSNGISVNYRHTANEPKGAVLRMVAKGGRSLETLGGAVAVGVRTLSEAGTVGSWEREQVSLRFLQPQRLLAIQMSRRLGCGFRLEGFAVPSYVRRYAEPVSRS